MHLKVIRNNYWNSSGTENAKCPPLGCINSCSKTFHSSDSIELPDNSSIVFELYLFISKHWKELPPIKTTPLLVGEVTMDACVIPTGLIRKGKDGPRKFK